MHFDIRPANESDIAFILAGYSHVVRDNLMQTEMALTAEQIKRDILVSVPKAFIDVATCDNERAGFVIYSTVYFATFGQSIWVTTMYVDPFAPTCGLVSVSTRLLDRLSTFGGRPVGVFASIEKNNKNTQLLAKHYGAKPFDQFVIIGHLPQQDKT